MIIDYNLYNDISNINIYTNNGFQRTNEERKKYLHKRTKKYTITILISQRIAENENISKMYKYIQCNTSNAFYFHACICAHIINILSFKYSIYTYPRACHEGIFM